MYFRGTLNDLEVCPVINFMFFWITDVNLHSGTFFFFLLYFNTSHSLRIIRINSPSVSTQTRFQIIFNLTTLTIAWLMTEECKRRVRRNDNEPDSLERSAFVHSVDTRRAVKANGFRNGIRGQEVSLRRSTPRENRSGSGVIKITRE